MSHYFFCCSGTAALKLNVIRSTSGFCNNLERDDVCECFFNCVLSVFFFCGRQNCVTEIWQVSAMNFSLKKQKRLCNMRISGLRHLIPLLVYPFWSTYTLSGQDMSKKKNGKKTKKKTRTEKLNQVHLFVCDEKESFASFNFAFQAFQLLLGKGFLNKR